MHMSQGLIEWLGERLSASRVASRGQGMVEYALIIALVAVVVIAALVLLGPAISNIFTQINNSL